MLRNLSSDYYHNHINAEDYRTRRKLLLDRLDEELNGVSNRDSSAEDESVVEDN